MELSELLRTLNLYLKDNNINGYLIVSDGEGFILCRAINRKRISFVALLGPVEFSPYQIRRELNVHFKIR
jgi:hypothetical protein